MYVWRVYRSVCTQMAGNNGSTPVPIDTFLQYRLYLFMNSPRELGHQQKEKMDCPCNQHLHYCSSKSEVLRGPLASCFYSWALFIGQRDRCL